MTKYAALCVVCRHQFTEEEIENAKYCPQCKSTGTPADPNDTITLTLTLHELRLLSIWASNWGKQSGSPEVIEGIIMGIRSQAPDLPPLTMAEEFIEVRNNLPEGATMEVVDSNGNTSDDGGKVH